MIVRAAAGGVKRKRSSIGHSTNCATVERRHGTVWGTPETHGARDADGVPRVLVPSRRHARRTVSVTLGEMRPDALPLCEGPLWSPESGHQGGSFTRTSSVNSPHASRVGLVSRSVLRARLLAKVWLVGWFDGSPRGDADIRESASNRPNRHRIGGPRLPLRNQVHRKHTVRFTRGTQLFDADAAGPIGGSGPARGC